MTEVDCTPGNLTDFVNSGRTGRRNAVPDIYDEKQSKVGTGSLSFDMDKLQCSDGATGSAAGGATSQTKGAEGGSDKSNSQGT